MIPSRTSALPSCPNQPLSIALLVWSPLEMGTHGPPQSSIATLVMGAGHSFAGASGEWKALITSSFWCVEAHGKADMHS